MKKLFASATAGALMLSVVAGNVAYAAPVAEMPIQEEQLHMTVTVKWGNVRGTPQHTNKVSFDGDVSVTHGTVSLTKELYFERHDNNKDQVVSKQDPVGWTSWIYGKWDGVRVDVKAPRRADLLVSTDAGGLVIPVEKLATNENPVVLNLGDGREIVVNVNMVHTDPFLIRAYWGGPTPRIEPGPTPLPLPVEPQIQKVDGDAAIEKIEKAIVADIVRPIIYPYYPRTDFTGALAVGNGAKINLIETLRFEPRHGDKITSSSNTSVYWDSFIYGHYDGVLLKAKLDDRNPRDDTIAVKFGELGWSREISLAKLYAAGTARFEIKHNGRTYHLVLQAIKQPYCTISNPPCLTPAQAEALPEEVPTPVAVDLENEAVILKEE